MTSIGNHVFLDIIGFVDYDVQAVAQWFEQLMNKAIAQTHMKNMFSKMIVLDEGTENEGFTSVILLNESHLTAHAYTRRGLLAIDLFTCGDTNPSAVVAYLRNEIVRFYPEVRITNFSNNKRFKTSEYFNHDYE
jgi:S-adenosylmethionine decarboxylase